MQEKNVFFCKKRKRKHLRIHRRCLSSYNNSGFNIPVTSTHARTDRIVAGVVSLNEEMSVLNRLMSGTRRICCL